MGEVSLTGLTFFIVLCVLGTILIILDLCMVSDYTVYMDYMDLAVRCPQKGR